VDNIETTEILAKMGESIASALVAESQTDLAKMKTSLDGLDIDCHIRDYSDGFLWLDIYGDCAHIGVEIKFHKDGSRFRANGND